MNAKQEAFVREYLVDLSATQAAIRAGYSKKTAGQIGWQLLKKLQNEIHDAYQARAERVDVRADRVLEEIALAAFLDPILLFAENGTLLPLSAMPAHARRAIAGIEVEEIFDGRGEDRQFIGYLKKIKLVSKEGTLTLAGRHLGMFTDKNETKLTSDAPILVKINRKGE